MEGLEFEEKTYMKFWGYESSQHEHHGCAEVVGYEETPRLIQESHLLGR